MLDLLRVDQVVHFTEEPGNVFPEPLELDLVNGTVRAMTVVRLDARVIREVVVPQYWLVIGTEVLETVLDTVGVAFIRWDFSGFHLVPRAVLARRLVPVHQLFRHPACCRKATTDMSVVVGEHQGRTSTARDGRHGRDSSK